MKLSDFEKEKELQKDLQNLLEGKVTFSKSELLDYLKKETPEVEEEQVEEISEKDSEEVSFKELIDEPIEEIPETNEESVIEEPNKTQETPIVSRMDRLLDEVESPSEPTVAPKAGTFLVAGGGGENNTISNIGGGVEIYSDKYGPDLRLRTISATGAATVTRVGDLIVIGASTSSAPSDSWMGVSANYYTKTQVNSISSTLYSELSGDNDTWPTVSANYYTSSQTNNLLSNKADLSAVSGDNDTWPLVSASYYTRTQVVDGTPDFQILDFNTTAYSATDPIYQEGRVFWDYTNHTLAMYNDNSEVKLQIGQESWIRVVNRTTSAIPNGTVVRINGAQGDRPTIIPVIADSSYGAEGTIGIATHHIGVNEEGYITTEGIVNDVNTSGFYLGAPLFLSDTVSGGYRTTPPPAPATTVFVGICTRVHQNTGKIFATIRVNSRIASLSDVDGNIPRNGYILGYNSVSSMWDATNQLNTSGGFTFGTSASFSKFEQDTGFISAAGSACAWDDLLSPATSINPAGSPTPPSIDNTDGSLIFTATGVNTVTVWFQLPHAWKVGSELRPHLHWYKSASTSGYVNWEVKYKYAGLGASFGSFTGLLSGTVQVPDSNSANVHAITRFPVIDGSGLTISSMVCVWVQRTTTSGDTYSGNAHLIGVDIHYQKDTQGSRQEYIK